MDFEVLILGTDANSYYMARCCYEAYHKKAYVIGTKRLAFTKFSNILNVSYNPNMWDEEGFLKILEDFQTKHSNKKIILVSTNETYTEFISKNKDKINENYLFNVPDIKTIKSLTDKELFYKTYENSSLIFPKTIYFNTQDDDINEVVITYPVVIKPANVVEFNHLDFVGKNKIYKVSSEEELYNVITNIKNSGYKSKLIIQEFIPGDDSNLFDAVMYVNSKGKVEFCTYAQIGLQERTKSMVGNAAVLINGFNTTDGDVLKQVKNLRKFIESIGYRGFCEVDMKYDIRDDTFKVLEINARQGRSSYYVCSLGKNLIKTLVDDLLYNTNSPYEFLDSKVLLSFVPKGIVRKYIKNKRFKKQALKMWHHVVKPMDSKEDKNFKRFLLLRKRWLHYYKEYKNSYWR
jgi:D-aspartate ligase